MTRRLNHTSLLYQTPYMLCFTSSALPNPPLYIDLNIFYSEEKDSAWLLYVVAHTPRYTLHHLHSLHICLTLHLPLPPSLSTLHHLYILHPVLLYTSAIFHTASYLTSQPDYPLFTIPYILSLLSCFLHCTLLMN